MKEYTRESLIIDFSNPNRHGMGNWFSFNGYSLGRYQELFHSYSKEDQDKIYLEIIDRYKKVHWYYASPYEREWMKDIVKRSLYDKYDYMEDLDD